MSTRLASYTNDNLRLVPAISTRIPHNYAYSMVSPPICFSHGYSWWDSELEWHMGLCSGYIPCRALWSSGQANLFMLRVQAWRWCPLVCERSFFSNLVSHPFSLKIYGSYIPFAKKNVTRAFQWLFCRGVTLICWKRISLFHIQGKMKSTEVQTLGELRMRDTANWWAGLLVCVYSWSHTRVARGESDTG